MLPNSIRPHIDTFIAVLMLLVTLYYRLPKEKREAWELRNPRWASFVGFIAALVPFLPWAASQFKGIITGHHEPLPEPSRTAQADSVPPFQPWHETRDSDHGSSSSSPGSGNPLP